MQKIAEQVGPAIPVSRMLEGEVKKPASSMEERLRDRVIGQDAALSVVANAIRRSRAGLSRSEKPIGSFHLSWADGRGQDRNSRELAEFLFDDEQAAGDPHRHERVHGEACRGAADWRTSGLHRLRRRRPVDRGSAAQTSTRSSCSTRSKRRIPASSTYCCR